MNRLEIEISSAELTHFEILEEVAVDTVYNLALVPLMPDLVLDCGGHIGLFTALATARYPDAPTVTFEPNPDNAAYISRLIERNNLQTVRLVQAAVSVEAGKATFFRRNTVGGSLSQSAPGVVDSFEVDVFDLPSYLAKQSPARLLVKMDIEGEESRLLPALLPVMPPATAIFFETHNGADDWNPLERVLRSAGFEVTLLRSRDPYRDGYAVRRGDVPSLAGK